MIVVDWWIGQLEYQSGDLRLNRFRFICVCTRHDKQCTVSSKEELSKEELLHLLKCVCGKSVTSAVMIVKFFHELETTENG